MKKRTLSGSVTVFAMIMLGLIIGMYLMGFSSPIMMFVQEDVLDDEGNVDESLSAQDVLGAIRDSVFANLWFLGLTAGFAIVAGVFGANYIGQSLVAITIPAFLLFIVANVLFFPIMSYSEAEGLPIEINFILVIVFNVMLLLAIISFVSGRD